MIWLIVAGTGYQVVGHSKDAIRQKRDAVILSAISGMVAGAIDGLAQVVVALLIPYIQKFISGGLSGNDALILALSPLIVLMIIIATSIMAIIGGVIYLARMVKIS